MLRKIVVKNVSYKLPFDSEEYDGHSPKPVLFVNDYTGIDEIEMYIKSHFHIPDMASITYDISILPIETGHHLTNGPFWSEYNEPSKPQLIKAL